ncbi:hypothetical protein [Lysobacter hankyongensis]|uniref:DUF2513 domain-containing protein n=1 Tax=Lysobacter hankyongensis TaxID=1176535 RepID=A0ABP9ASZ8_9GAMM
MSEKIVILEDHEIEYLIGLICEEEGFLPEIPEILLKFGISKNEAIDRSISVLTSLIRGGNSLIAILRTAGPIELSLEDSVDIVSDPAVWQRRTDWSEAPLYCAVFTEIGHENWSSGEIGKISTSRSRELFRK